MSQEILIEKCKKQDPLAQKMLFEKYGPKLYTVCRRYAKTTDQADDILQMGFVKIFKSMNSYQGSGSFEGWMRRIIVNTALDLIRKNRHSDSNQDIDDYAYQIADDEKIYSEFAAEEILKLLILLPHGYRTVFNLYVLEGFSHKEIADELDISVSTSKSQLSRAKSMLRKIITEREMHI